MKYKHLTKEQRDILKNEIKLHGKDETFKKIAKNILTSHFVDLMNEDDAWNVIRYNQKTGDPVYEWYEKIYDIVLTDFEKEILYCIDKDYPNHIWF